TKTTPEAKSSVSDVSASFWAAIPKDIGTDFLNLWLNSAGYIVSAINEPTSSANVPDLYVKLGHCSKEYGEAIDAALQMPVADASPDQIRDVLREFSDLARASGAAIEHLEMMLADKSRPAVADRRTSPHVND
ncbi:MAG: hypothetical protein ACRCYN_11300, partial [Plesiomonas sp.]